MSKQVKAVAYARVSTLLNQDPENQLIAIRAFAEARGFTLVDEYVDRISGTKESRPELDRLVADARRGQFKILIVAAIDRVSRSTKHLLNLLDELKVYGVSLISLRENLDFSTPTGQLALTMLAGVSTLERQLTSDRISQALASKKLKAKQTGNGWRCGRPPAVNNELRKQIQEMRSQGLSVNAIWRALDRKISRTTVLRTIRGHR